MNDLFNRPNLDIAADVATVQPVLDVNLVTTGTVIHEGYTSMLTAGPKTGFGLIPLDGGIRFYSSQSMFFVTLIHDFQQRLAQDPQGQKATQLYDFTARTYDWSNLTVTKTITPDGLRLSPSLTHNIDAVICSAPTQGNGLKRGIAALIGMNQDKITEKVKEGRCRGSGRRSRRNPWRRRRSGARSSRRSGTPTSGRRICPATIPRRSATS